MIGGSRGERGGGVKKNVKHVGRPNEYERIFSISKFNVKVMAV